MVHPKGTQEENKQDTDPRQSAYQRNDFSEPRLRHLPIQRKALNSLPWDIWFSFINNNLLTFWLPGLCCKTPINPPPLTFFLGDMKVHQTKHKTPLLGCAVFQSTTLNIKKCLCPLAPSFASTVHCGSTFRHLPNLSISRNTAQT